jgi:hypothetical protein
LAVHSFKERYAVRPPPIRYPLPTLIVVIALVLLGRWGAELLRPVREAVAARWKQVVEGPPVPSSSEPQVVAGPMVRRALLLHDKTPATARPGGPPVETIGHRMIADVYDVWPVRGEPTDYRIGARRPIGWVAAADVLPWDTRLVIRVPRGTLALADFPGSPASAPVEVGTVPLPVLAWTEGAIRVAVWDRDRPWTEVARRGWVRTADVPAESWGVWLSREELLDLLRRTLAPAAVNDAQAVRLRTLLGRLADNTPLAAADLKATRDALPAAAFAAEAADLKPKSEVLARFNEQWTPDASWSGVSFRAIPLSALP